MSAGQEVGPLDREGRSLIQPPLPPDEATWALAAAAGVSTVGLRPSFVTPAAAHSHPDCRAILILIVAPHDVPWHGATTGFIVNYSPDSALRFDLDGNPVEYLDRAYRLTAQFELMIGGREVPAQTFAKHLGLRG